MDPNEALRIIRDLCQYIIDEDGTWGADDPIASFADEFAALDNWIVNGGFLPTDWNAK